MSPMIDIAASYGRFLSSRRLARELRMEVERLVATGHDPVTVSFEGVESISSSFADGFLGILVVEHGRSWLDRHIHLRGLQPEDRRDIEAILEIRNVRASVA